MTQAKKTRAKPKPRIKPASTAGAWMAGKKHDMQQRIDAGEPVTFCYLLTDDVGIALIAQGVLTDDVIEQARRACEWCLIPLPVDKEGAA